MASKVTAVAPYPVDVETPGSPGYSTAGSREQLVSNSRASSGPTSVGQVNMEGDYRDEMELGGVENGNYSGEEVPPQSGELRRSESAEILHVSIHQAARDGDVDLMKRLIATFTNKKKRINMKDEDQMTPLHYAARYNHYHIVRVLVENGANIHTTGEDEATALHLSARFKRSRLTSVKSEVELAKRQKSVGSNPDSSDPSASGNPKYPARLPPLKNPPKASKTDASPNGQEFDSAGQPVTESVIHYLVSKGANVNAQDMYGSTPLHFASMRGNDVATRELLECRGINIEAADKQQMTALHLACGHGNVECCRLLIDAGANLRCTDEENGTPLHFAGMEGQLKICNLLFDAAYHKDGWVTISQMVTDTDMEDNTALHLAVDNGHLEIVKLCLEKKSDINTSKKNFSTPLHSAAALGNIEIVTLLLEHNARIDALDENQATPLHRACAFNRWQVVEYLLDMKAKIERRDQDNFTPLLIAACYGHSETIKCLLDHNADISKADKNDKTALYWTAEEDRLDALKVLLEHPSAKNMLEETDKYDNTPLHVAAQNGYFGIVKTLLDAGAIIDPRNEEEQTPLHLAAKNGRTRTVRELVRRNKMIINDEDELSNSPLHLAALEGHVQTLKALLDIGADIQARNCNLWTPLDCAAAKGWVKTSLALLEADSPVDPTDKAKTTPLHLASKNGHVDVVQLLLKWNADLSFCDDTGSNCLDLAIDNNKKDVAMAIINHPNWKKAMENATADPSTGIYDTPMRKLIRKMPDAAEKVLQRCTKANDKPIEHPEYKISFEYDFMDDMFTNWRHDDPISDAMSSKSDSVFEEDGSLKPAAQPYSKDAMVLKKNHPLMIMVRSKREELLGHPLCISLLRHKWNKYGRMVYYISLFIYCVFLAALTSYILLMPPPYYVYEHPNGTKVWYLNGEDKFNNADPNNLTLSPVVDIFKWIVIGLACFNILKELFQMMTQRLNYFGLENLMEWAIYILALLVVIDFSSDQRTERWREPWQWTCAAICIFLAWMNLIVFIRKLPRLGIYVVMFIDVLNTFLKFFIVFFLFIIAFGLAFYVLLMNQEPFQTAYLTFVKTFVMMIGEFEYDSIFFGDDYLQGETPDITSDEYFAHTVWYSEVTYVLFVLFLIIMSIIIMNLLVGLAVDDIKEVQEQAVLKRYAMQVELALDVEQLIPQFIQRKFIVRKETIEPNYVYKNPVTRLYYYFAGTSAISAPSIAKALRPDLEPIDEVLENQEALTSTVNNLRTRVKVLQQQNSKIESMLAAIIQSQGISYEEEDGTEISE
ncbi:transient receptor potential cation channel subfamily A member 1 homolog isoform X2 [Ptychodera flava]|uniref:transient receptor potential cation channel subfamily A member 1 homolog isoform X2 n=1 Tax=Ptychodera flava TaxID=63121 RepID=UPI00396A636B